MSSLYIIPGGTAFRNKPSSPLLTKSLFYEHWVSMEQDKRSRDPIFSLHRDRPGLVNFRKEYLEDEDETGYKTAVRLLEGFHHFEYMLKTCKWFRDAKEEWDRELKAKLRARALDVVKQLAEDFEAKHSERLAAAKTLLFETKAPTPNKARGRPTKEEIEGELKREVELSKEVMEDLERINKVVKFTKP